MTNATGSRLRIYDTRLSDGSAYIEIWLEMPLDDAWMAAYRLLPHEGVPTAVELRIFPSTGERSAGRWMVDALGDNAAFPPTGVVASCVRAAKTGIARHLTPQDRRVLVEVWGSSKIRPEAGGVAVGPGVVTGGAAAMRRGPKGKGDVFYAAVARAYHQAIERGEQAPNRWVAYELQMSSKYAAELVAKARRKGLLTPASGPGRADGAMTDKARQILADETSDAG